jgi:Immunoglobulin-like domain of bacterial spore germination/Sporulation and spore germination
MNPEDVLREALEARASLVEASPDALPRIRARLASRRVQRRRVLTIGFASLATGAVASVIAVALGLGSCLPTQPGPVPGGSSSPPATPPGPTPTSARPTVATVRAPVYFVGGFQGRRVLYWEYHQVPTGALTARLEGALSAMLAGAATDPDYTSDWPAGVSVRSVRIDPDAIVVDLAGAGVAPTDPQRARAAVQQLVYTATGVAADQGVSRAGVRLLFDGATRTTPWGGINVAGRLTRGTQIDTLAPVWLVSPQEGNAVGRSFDAYISGTVFEATVRLVVRNSAGTVVQDHVLMLSAGAPERGEVHTTITLTPGSYTLEAFFVSLADGSIQGLDGHHIVVS